MKKLGVIGGMGPMATANFIEMVVCATSAAYDQDHIDMVIYHMPSIPDRTRYIMGESGDSPYESLLHYVMKLSSENVDYIAIPCMTSHYFYNDLSCELLKKGSKTRIINGIEETVLKVSGIGSKKAGILATRGCISTGLFQKALIGRGIEAVIPSDSEQDIVTDIIYNGIKAGKGADMDAFYGVTESLKRKGCDSIILGCTELSLINNREKLKGTYIDAAYVLAEKCVRSCKEEINE